MVMARWQATITDTAGNVLPAASITVRREVAGSPLASLFSDRAGAVPMGNPFTAGLDGYAAFHVAGGAYRITASLGGVTREWRYVAVGLAAETDDQPPGVAFRFDSGTSDADPGAGNFRFNNATPASATKLFISQVSPEGLDVGAWLATWDDAGNSGNRGSLVIQGGNGTALLVATVTGTVVDDGAYYDVPVSVISATSADSFIVGGRCGVVFTGRGTDGIVAGPVSSVVGNFASWGDATGDTLADSGQSPSTVLKVANNLSDVADAATTFGNIKQAASDIATGVAELAVQSEMEAAIDVVRIVTPGLQHFHPGHPKMWGRVTVSGGVPTLAASYNITSITDAGQGILTATIATDFSSANWAPGVTSIHTVAQVDSLSAVQNGTPAAGTVGFLNWQTGASSNPNLQDPEGWSFWGFGDQT